LLERIGDVLSQQTQGTSALGRYQGNGPVSPEALKSRLKQLIAKIKSLLASFPPQIAAMLQSLLADAEALLATGGPSDAIGAMIAKLEKIVAILLELMQELTDAGGQLNLDALIAFLQGMAQNLDAAKKEQIAKLIRQLRRASLTSSIKGLDEASWDDEGLTDGSKPVEPIAQNVIGSLQALLEAIFAPADRAINR
jgi:hypothetical protein